MVRIVGTRGQSTGGAISISSLRAFRALDARENGVWSSPQESGRSPWTPNRGGPGRGALVKLHRVLPVPTEGIPLAELLEFKAKRRDELLNLRTHLERVYQQIARAIDVPLAMNTELVALERSLDDYIRTARESL